MILYTALAVSLIANLALLYFINKRLKERPLTKDAHQVLHDLTAHGRCMIKIERVDPDNFLLRSPYLQ